VSHDKEYGLKPKKTNNPKIGLGLIKKIKPLLSDSPIMRANVEIGLNDISVINVEFILTDEILKAMTEDI